MFSYFFVSYTSIKWENQSQSYASSRINLLMHVVWLVQAPALSLLNWEKYFTAAKTPKLLQYVLAIFSLVNHSFLVHSRFWKVSLIELMYLSQIQVCARGNNCWRVVSLITSMLGGWLLHGPHTIESSWSLQTH